MLNWLKEWLGPAAAAANPVAQGVNDAEPSEVAGLDFRTAINAHMRWKIRLRAVIDGRSDEAIDPETLARDDQCPLGKWLHGSGGAQFRELPLFAELTDQHAEFHLHAASVLEQAQQGYQHEALRALEHGPYAQSSGRVAHLLARLFVQLSKRVH
jgi:hypothetical protein